MMDNTDKLALISIGAIIISFALWFSYRVEPRPVVIDFHVCWSPKGDWDEMEECSGGIP